MIGVYKITNIVNKKIYIGSSKDIEKRWYRHKFDLNSNSHHSVHLQRAWNKYGEKNFRFQIIEETNLEQQFIKEQYYLNIYKSWNEDIGYNINRKAEGGARFGEFSPRAKLTNKEVEKIKIRYLNGESSHILGLDYGISDNTVLYIVKGKSYSEVRPDLTEKILNMKINKKTRQEIAYEKFYIEQKSIEEIALILNCSYNRVQSLISRQKVKLGKGKKIKSKTEQLEQRNKIIELYNNGKAIIEIIKMGYASTTVRRTIKKLKGDDFYVIYN